jgi:type IV fimbrial biogenesis protein FimT
MEMAETIQIRFDQRKNGAPFVVPFMPFVWHNKPTLLPLIPINIPFIGIWRKYSGFSLLELIITLSILAILATVAIPSMSTVIQNNRRTTQVNDFVADLNMARTEAIKRGGTSGWALASISVVVCAGTGTNCAGTDFTAGRLIFVDTDNDSTIDANEDTLRVRESLTGSSNSLKASNGGLATIGATPVSAGGGVIQFGGRGTVTNGVGYWAYTLCDSRGPANGRLVVLNTATGQVQVMTAPPTTCI